MTDVDFLLVKVACFGCGRSFPVTIEKTGNCFPAKVIAICAYCSELQTVDIPTRIYGSVMRLEARRKIDMDD